MSAKLFSSLLMLTFILGACSTPPAKPSTPPVNPAAAGGGEAFEDNPLRWKMVSEQDGIQLYNYVSPIPGRINLRAKTTVHASIEKVATALTDLNVRKQWTSNLLETKIVRKISDFERVEYSKMRAGFPYQYTDFICKVTFSILREPRSLLMRMASVTDPAYPVSEGTARAEIINSYNFARQIDADTSELVIEMGVDPKGALASWGSQDKVILWFGETMRTLRSVVEDPHFKVSREVQNYVRTHQI